MRYERITLLLVLLVALGICSCGGSGGGGETTDPGTETYRVSGQVRDINGNGVPGVTISLESPGQNYSDITDASGSFSYMFQSAATFTIRASMAGYDITPASHTVTVDREITGITFDLDSSIIRFSPPSLTIPGVGQTGLVYVTVDEVTSLNAANFIVTYDPSIIEVVTVLTMADGYLFDVDDGLFLALPTVIDSIAGTIEVGMGITGIDGVSGSGILAGITFRGKQAGTSTLTFIDNDQRHPVLNRSTQSGVPEEIPILSYTASVTVNP